MQFIRDYFKFKTAITNELYKNVQKPFDIEIGKKSTIIFDINSLPEDVRYLCNHIICLPIEFLVEECFEKKKNFFYELFIIKVDDNNVTANLYRY